MAEEQIVTNIVANADFSKLIADVNKVTASLSKLQQEIIQADTRLSNQVSNINRAFGENLRRTGQFSTHFVTLTSDVEKFGQNLDGGKLKLKQYFQAFQDHTKTTGGLIRQLAQQQVQMQNAILQPLGKNAQGMQQFNVHIPRGLDVTKNKTALARQELQILNKVIQDGGVQLINWGKNTQWAGRQLTVGLTVPMAAFGKAAADAFKQADQELTRLTKVYGGLTATSSTELAKVRKDVSTTAKELASAYGSSYTDTIALAADIAATGKQGNDLLAATKETTRLAVLGEVDRQDAMKATLAIQSTFKQNTDQLSESINFLNAVENQTSTTLGDLIEAIPKAGPVIKGMGGSVKDLALYLTAMREGGISAAEGANALKSSLASLINPTKVATNMFAGFGIDLKGIVTKNAGNLTGTILELQSALDKLNPLQKQQALEQLFGKFQFARMNALFSNLGKQGSQTLQVIDLMKASSQDLANIAGRELAQVTESASGKYKRALESLKADLATVGEQFLKINTSVLKVLDGVVKFFNKLPEPIKQALTFVGGLTALAGPLIMLTGVLANFFGYIIKGAAHFKSLFKGGEGWKMLTPEMLAAQKAGTLIESTFYSDAKAALALETAVRGLRNEFSILEQKAKAGAISINPALQAMATNVGIGPGRQVNAAHPLLSPTDTRSMSHMNPVAGMTIDQKAQQTLFGVVPGAPRINQKISNAPQMYATGNLPIIPGLTTAGGVSTGVVAEEAAKWHSMTGALAMQSQSELKILKKEVLATGQITSELSASYQALLPTITQLVTNAANESAAIVAELQADKLNVDQARAKIIALNAQVEASIGQAVTDVASLQGRTANLTSVPLLNQPIVDVKTGKSNMKELFRPGRTRDLLNKIARGLGVKTYGAPYSTETTIPKRLHNGGAVYLATGGDPATHPGRPIGTDTIPAWLSEGEYVVRKEAVTPQTLPILELLNNTKGGEQYRALALLEHAGIPVDKLQNSVYPMTHSSNLQSRGGAGIPSSYYLNEFADPNIYRMTNALLEQQGLNPISTSQHNKIISSLKASVNKPNISETEFGRHLLDAYKSAGLSKEQLSVIRANNTMRFKFPGTGTITERRDSLIKTLESKYAGQGLKFSVDPKSNQNIIVSGAGKDFKIRHEATRAINQVTGGGSYELLRQKNPAGARDGAQLAYSHIALPSDLEPLTAPNPATPSKLQMYARPIHGNGKGFFPLNSMFTRTTGGWKQLSKPRDPMEAFKFGWGTAQTFRKSPGSMGRGNLRLHFADGGFVQGFQSQAAKGFVGQGLMRSGGEGLGMAGQMGIMMGGSAAGQMIGGGAGTAITMAANILPWLPIQKMLPAIKNGVTSLKNLGGAAQIAGKAFGLLFRVGPILAVTAAITAAVAIFKMWKKHHEDATRNAQNLYGVTEKGAKELGIKYNNLSDSIKNVNEQLKLQRANGKAAYEAFTNAGGTGITLSIKQLKDLQNQVKTSMPDMLATINSLNQTDLGRFAQNIKAQMIASGKSVSDTNNLIYALISQSNKANMAFSTIASSGFTQIIDRGTAANVILKNLSDNMTNISNADPKAFASNIDSVISVLDSSVKALIGTKDATGATITEAQAIAMQYQKMADNGLKNKKLTQEGLDILKKERPELAAILNKSDTIAGVYSKWRLLLSGVSGDLSKLNSAQAEALAKYEQGLSAAAAASKTSTSSNNSLATSAKAVNTLKTQLTAAQKAANSTAAATAGLTKAQIKAINDTIKAINAQADAKKKALQESLDAGNSELEIQSAQLEYQQALARGDRDAAAQAQIRIQQLTKQAQTTKAIQQIEDNRQKQVDAQQAKLDADQLKKDAAATAATNAGSTATTLSNKLTTITDFQNTIAALGVQQANINNMPAKTQAEKDARTKAQNELVIGPLKSFLDQLSKASKDIKAAFPQFFDKSGNVLSADAAKTINFPKTGAINVPQGGALTEIQTLAKQYDSSAKTITGGKSLKDIWDLLGGKQDVTKTLSESQVLADIKKNQGGSSADLKNMLDKDGYLKESVRASIIMTEKLKRGDSFTYDNTTYNVTDGYDAKVKAPRAVRRASGGRFVPGVPYMLNDGGKMEGIKFDMPGTVFPNANTMPRYNIPTNTITGMSSGYANNSYNNNYSINIALNGTNVTMDDAVKRMKAEMALINAKEGRNKKVGGMI